MEIMSDENEYYAREQAWKTGIIDHLPEKVKQMMKIENRSKF